LYFQSIENFIYCFPSLHLLQNAIGAETKKRAGERIESIDTGGATETTTGVATGCKIQKAQTFVKAFFKIFKRNALRCSKNIVDIMINGRVSYRFESFIFIGIFY
jgi:hypothetical protein